LFLGCVSFLGGLLKCLAVCVFSELLLLVPVPR